MTNLVHSMIIYKTFTVDSLRLFNFPHYIPVWHYIMRYLSSQLADYLLFSMLLFIHLYIFFTAVVSIISRVISHYTVCFFCFFVFFYTIIDLFCKNWFLRVILHWRKLRDVRCDEKSISSKIYKWKYAYWGFGKVRSW